MLDPSKDTVLCILDILESWTAPQVLAEVTSEMGINIKDHQIAYKTSKMRVKDNAGLAVQCGIQSHTFEQKHLKMFNLVSFIFLYPLQLLH